MTALHYKLNLDISTALKKDFSLQVLIDEIENSDRPGHIWRFDAQDFFDPDWHQTMYNLGMNFGSSLVFYRKAHYIHPTAHIDLSWSDKKPTVSAINWCVGKDDGDMIWYNEKSPAAETEQDQLLTPADTLYVERELAQLDEIDRYQIGSTPTLVRTDVFHNVEVRAHPRLCISARCRTIPVLDELTWENTVEFYKPFIA
jgi:hypothetical protein